jgi:rSAM/selenodomain-associated transferase 2
VSLRAPAISVVIPTFNEAHTIGGLLENLKTLGPAEVVVADGSSTDQTAEVASRYARVLSVARCRALQMNAGAHACSGDVLLFLHADVRLGSRALDAVRESMRVPEVVGGNFDIRYEGGDWVSGAFTRINRTRRRCGVFYGDSGIFCRREVFDALGGYRPWPILEDYDFARRLRRSGKLALLDEPIWVSDRRWRTAGLLPTLWSWFWIQGLYLVGVSPERLAVLYRHVRSSNGEETQVELAPGLVVSRIMLVINNIAERLAFKSHVFK